MSKQSRSLVFSVILCVLTASITLSGSPLRADTASSYALATVTNVAAGWSLDMTLTDSGGDDGDQSTGFLAVSVSDPGPPYSVDGWSSWEITLTPPATSPPALAF